MILSPDFFDRPAPRVARDLIGKFLVRKMGKITVASKIIETEAYEGFEDLASHASKKRTPRNEVMFDEAGTIYVYFVYGMHYMLNIVTGKKEYPAAVLIRGIEIAHGPGRLTKFLSIDKNLNGYMIGEKSGLWFEDRGEKLEVKNIKNTSRIGVAYAGPIWSKKKYRFVYEDE